MPGVSLGSAAGGVNLQQFNPLQAGTFVYRPDTKFVLGSAAGAVQLPPEGGADTIIVATWEDDLVAQLALTAIPTTRTTMYTVPTGRNAIIRFIDCINDTASAITVQLWIDGVKIIPSKSVPGNDTYSRNGIWDIGPGDLIEAQASGAGANLSISGVLELTA